MLGNDTSSHTEADGLVHEALIYHGDSDLADALAGFLRASAAADEPVLVALPPDKLQRLGECLAEHAPAAEFSDITPMAGNPACLLSVVSDWLGDRHGRARVVSEALWPGRSYPETVECLRHDALVNHALADIPGSILSAFDGESLDAETLAGAELTHPTVLEHGVRRRSPQYEEPLALLQSDRWPLESRPEPASEHAFTGSLRELRRAVAHDPLLQALSPERQADFVLAINEAATNAVRHGDERCRAAVWRDATRVVAEIACLSSVEDPLAGRRRPAVDAPGGRGLWLINQLCDLVELRSDEDGTTVRMHMQAA